MTRTTGRAVALLLTMAAASACKGSKDEPPQVTPAVSSAANGAVTTSAAAANDEALSQKLGKYIDCYNRLTSNVFRTWKRYASWVDEKTGPTGKERNVYGLYELTSVELCEKEIAAGNSAAPSLPELHAEADAYKTALVALAQQVNDAARYYTGGDYKDDQWAKAKTMHAPLLAAFEKFKEANTAFDRRLGQLNDEIALRQLAELEKDPNSRLEALSRRAMHEAKGLLDFVEIENIDELPAEPYAARLDAFDKAVAALRAHADGHKDEAAQLRGLDTLLGELQEYLTAAKELQRRKRDNNDFAKEKPAGGLFNRVDGHPAQVIEKYNDAVGASNRLAFTR
jgi:hypothetical protein